MSHDWKGRLNQFYEEDVRSALIEALRANGGERFRSLLHSCLNRGDRELYDRCSAFQSCAISSRISHERTPDQFLTRCCALSRAPCRQLRLGATMILPPWQLPVVWLILIVMVVMVVMPIFAPITVVIFAPTTVVFFVPTVVMLCAVVSHVRAAMVPALRAPMTSAMRSNMDRRGVFVVLIVVRLRNASEADDQGNRSGDWHRPSRPNIQEAVHDAYSSLSWCGGP